MAILHFELIFKCELDILLRVGYIMDHILSLSYTQKHIQHLGHFSLSFTMWSDNNVPVEYFAGLVFQYGKPVRFGHRFGENGSLEWNLWMA